MQTQSMPFFTSLEAIRQDFRQRMGESHQRVINSSILVENTIERNYYIFEWSKQIKELVEKN